MSKSQELAREVKSFIIEQGADLVGIAPVDRFGQAPEGYRPNDYMPEACSVISLAVRIARGPCNTWGYYSKPGKSITPFLYFGGGALIDMEIGRIVNRAMKYLEDRGYQALAFPHSGDMTIYRWWGSQQGEAIADFSHKHAAVAAGLGEFGWHNLVITPEFGSRVRLSSVITTAPLETDKMYEGEPLCQPERCNWLCVKECPAQAISLTEGREAIVGGRKFHYAQIDRIRHFYGINGLVKGSGSLTGNAEIPAGRGDFKHLQQALANQRRRDKVLREGTSGFCSRCFRECPAPFVGN